MPTLALFVLERSVYFAINEDWQASPKMLTPGHRFPILSPEIK